jgi:hypothetical protein
LLPCRYFLQSRSLSVLLNCYGNLGLPEQDCYSKRKLVLVCLDCLLENGVSNTHPLGLVEVNLLAVMLVLVEVI